MAITIVVVLAGVVIPTMKGFQDEDRARRPLAEFADLVQEVRLRAERENRAYQVVFTPGTIFALAYDHPYDDPERFRQRIEALEQPPSDSLIRRETVSRGEILREALAGGGSEPSLFLDWFEDGLPGDGRPSPQAYLRRQEIPEDVEYETLFWGDPEWIEMDGTEFRRWVVQPRALVNPLRIRFTRRNAFFEAGVDALTGELVGERSSVSPEPAAPPESTSPGQRPPAGES